MTETLSLFPSTLGGPAGLRYQADFVSPDEEEELIAHIRQLPLRPFQFGAFEGNRRVASFGWRYDYGERKLQKAQEIPGWLAPVIARVETFAGPGSGPIRQALCTEYAEGVGIGWHRDKPHFDEVLGLSLASACKFRFRRKSGRSWERFTLDAEPRSLYIALSLYDDRRSAEPVGAQHSSRRGTALFDHLPQHAALIHRACSLRNASWRRRRATSMSRRLAMVVRSR